MQFKMYPNYFILHLLMLAKCWYKFGKNSLIGLQRTAEVMKNNRTVYRRLYKNVLTAHLLGIYDCMPNQRGP